MAREMAAGQRTAEERANEYTITTRAYGNRDALRTLIADNGGRAVRARK